MVFVKLPAAPAADAFVEPNVGFVPPPFFVKEAAIPVPFVWVVNVGDEFAALLVLKNAAVPVPVFWAKSALIPEE